jgi:SAM-dependent methyltransferase
MAFYLETLQKLAIPKDASILAVCGGEFDRDTLLTCGYSHVVISNLDTRVKGDEFAPFQWSFQDAESLTFEDNSFDYVIVHAGLHHCASPHRALLEMYRVARVGVLAIEARDSLMMRAAIALKRVPDYESGAVRAHNYLYGGVRNTCVPNFIYRWTENEIRKTIASYAPQAPHTIRFFYGLRLPEERIPFHGSRSLHWLSQWISAGTTAFAHIFHKQGNLFAFYIEKPDASRLFPWLKSPTEFNREYVGI